MVCQKAVTLIVDLCLHNSTLVDQDTCQNFLFLLSSQSSDHKDQGKNRNEFFCIFRTVSSALHFKRFKAIFFFTPLLRLFNADESRAESSTPFL